MRLRAFAAVMTTLALAPLTPADMLKFSNAGSTIEFVGTKKDGSHTGGFKKFAGTIDAPDGDFAKAKLTVEIQTASLHADNDKLTAHLKSPDFFDVRAHPTARFVSTRIKTTDGDGPASHLIFGELTLHGVTKPVQVPVRAEATATGLKLTGKFVIQRKDFGMTFGEGQVNNDVSVTLTVQASR